MYGLSAARWKSPCWGASSSRSLAGDCRTRNRVGGFGQAARRLSHLGVTFAGSVLAAVAGLGVFASLMVEASGAPHRFCCAPTRSSNKAGTAAPAAARSEPAAVLSFFGHDPYRLPLWDRGSPRSQPGFFF
jgi:hypothetical protein